MGDRKLFLSSLSHSWAASRISKSRSVSRPAVPLPQPLAQDMLLFPAKLWEETPVMDNM